MNQFIRELLSGPINYKANTWGEGLQFLVVGILESRRGQSPFVRRTPAGRCAQKVTVPLEHGFWIRYCDFMTDKVLIFGHDL